MTKPFALIGRAKQGRQKTIADLAKRHGLASDRWLTEPTELLLGWLGVDGAVVLDDNLRVLGFGYRLSGNGVSPTVELRLPSSPERVHRAVKLEEFSAGMRHRSAIEFCNANPAALAIVISSDGVISIFRSDPDQKDTVRAFRPIVPGTWMIG